MVREYVGAGELATFAEMLDAEQREERQQRQQAWKAEQIGITKLDANLDALYNECERLVTIQLVLAGYHRHKGQWRLRRGEDTE